MSEDLEQQMALMRPRLHRYCARMVGSAFDGEDVVQEALAKASVAARRGLAVEQMEGWLLRIAHNAAVDFLRRRGREARLVASTHAAGVLETAPEDATARVAAQASLAMFLQLPALPRAAVILVDVLGHSAEESREVLGTTLPALKAGLARGRTRLRALSVVEAPPRRMDEAERVRLQAYADRFNARDFDALRELLAEDVRLDLVSRTRMQSKADVGIYFTRYAERAHWRVDVGMAEGRPALLASDRGDPARTVQFVVLLQWAGEQIAAIRDFHYAPYIAEALIIEPAAPS